MPGSYGFFKNEVKLHLVSILFEIDRILDVGPGYGTYANLLKPELTNIDAIEIWEPYIQKFNLHSLYKNIFIGNILDFEKVRDYDYIIMGDVLEHIDTGNAQRLLTSITNFGIKCLVAIPYQYPQGEHDGNMYETYLQPDLTNEIFLNRYPEMKILFRNNVYGYYINY